MLQAIRKFLIVSVAMLQLFAPLVHAHTGSNHFSQGLHIPGLEPYLTDHDPAIGQQVNTNDSGLESEGLLILVDAGIKNPHDVIVDAGQDSFVALPANLLNKLEVPASERSFFQNSQVLNPRIQFSSLSPRAPPA